MNKYLVSANVKGEILIQNPPVGFISSNDALDLAAYLVSMAEHNADKKFDEVLKELYNS